MKREYTYIVAIVAALALLYFLAPQAKTFYAKARSVFNKQRSYVVKGTAMSGDDSGGVLTQAQSD